MTWTVARRQAVISRSLGIRRVFDKAAGFICTVDFARRCNGESSEISFCLGEIGLTERPA
ncbi:hypothetical protein [Neorhizobium sp. S3-V5DH]|uniref:hypothetical protein n=1 Tax=Neorhizobium sp. S3-V5DH TaxID=2485166 RepID=UPI001048FD0E|nr:hypothetical protein [Neorhizobium sp. S3-V5DH]